MVTASIIGVSLLAALLMGYLHYVSRQIAGNGIDPPWTYVWGVGLGIFVPFAIWCGGYWALVGDMAGWLPIVTLAAIIMGAGTGTIASYLVDWYTRYRSQAGKGERLLHDDKL